MELAQIPTLTPTPMFSETRPSLVTRARAAAPAAVDGELLTPPDPWNEALVAVALAAGRLRNALATADDDEWPALVAAHALHLARRRARELESLLADPEAAAGRVVCWAC
jgi:hypothetical protein